MRLKVTDKRGMHLRCCDLFADRARRFAGDVRVMFGDRAADGKSIVQLLALGVPPGGVIIVSGDADALATLAAMPGWIRVEDE